MESTAPDQTGPDHRGLLWGSNGTILCSRSWYRNRGAGQRVTVRGAAAEVGLSIATVSQVLNGGGNVVPRGTLSVSAAHFSGARAVTRHLVEFGHEQAVAWIFDQAGIAC